MYWRQTWVGDEDGGLPSKHIRYYIKYTYIYASIFNMIEEEGKVSVHEEEEKGAAYR